MQLRLKMLQGCNSPTGVTIIADQQLLPPAAATLQTTCAVATGTTVSAPTGFWNHVYALMVQLIPTLLEYLFGCCNIQLLFKCCRMYLTTN
jgi:hypothetical protein